MQNFQKVPNHIEELKNEKAIQDIIKIAIAQNSKEKIQENLFDKMIFGFNC